MTSTTVVVDGLAAEVILQPLDSPMEGLPALLADLSDDERRERWRHGGSLHLYRRVASRAYLRRLLGAALGCAARDVPLHASPMGQPRLPSGVEPALSFSVTHTDNALCIALSCNADLGVDMERCTPFVTVDELLPVACTPAESRWLSRLPAGTRQAAFLALWTRKEALFKGLGIGIVGRLRPQDVDVRDDGRDVRCLRVECGGRTWRLLPLALPNGLVGTVALAARS